MTYKNQKLGSELAMGLAVLAVLGLLVYPYWMPMGVIVGCIAALAALVFGMGIFVWREQPRDEREYHMASRAGRTAYLVGAAILTLGVATQTLQHHVDIWLVVGLGAMVLAKIATNTTAD